MVKMVKAVYVGRHRLLPAQFRALEELGVEIVRNVENLPTEPQPLAQLLNQLKDEGVEAVVTIALPPHLLAALSSKFRTFVFEMKSVTVNTIDEAEEFVRQNPSTRTYLPGRQGEPVRVLEFVGINEVKVIIESKRVWPR
jgi:predicted Fe-Mo cluster-binding NifX family protein